MSAVEAVAKRRVNILQRLFPDLSFEDDYMDTEDGERALIRILDANGDIKGLEFIEPEDLWTDPDIIDEYKETSEEGFYIAVIVPPEDRVDAESVIREEVGDGILVLGYDNLEPSPDAGGFKRGRE